MSKYDTTITGSQSVAVGDGAVGTQNVSHGAKTYHAEGNMQIAEHVEGTNVQAADGATVTTGGAAPAAPGTGAIATSSEAVNPITEEGMMPDGVTTEKYAMDKKQRGKALIINLKDFSHKTMIEKSRKGTDVDRDRLRDLWQWLGFQVTVYNDDDDIDDGEDIEQKVKDFASAENQKDAQCTVLCLLSHGSKGKIYAKSDKKGNPSVDIDKLVEILRECPELYGKPKLVFVQACRGSKQDTGTTADDVSVPLSGDVLEGYATTKDYVSWRTEEEGSRYIRILVEIFKSMATKMEIMQMMSEVQYRMCRMTTGSGRHQAAETVNSLTRKLFLKPLK